jgi:hypothetical protein
LENPLVSDACVEQTPFSSGSSLQGISQPKQNRDHGHNAHIVAPSVTARKVNGKSYPKLSSLQTRNEFKDNYQMKHFQRKTYQSVAWFA